MAAHYDRDTELGEEVHILLDELFNKMSKSRVKVKMQYNYANFIKMTTPLSVVNCSTVLPVMQLKHI